MKKVNMNALAREAKRGFERTTKGRAEWLVGTFQLAAALSEAREKLPADREFASWLVKAGLTKLNKDDRAALIVIGENVKEARKYFKVNTDAWSWRMCAMEIRSVSQAAKPASRYVTVRVVDRTNRVVVQHYVSAPEPPKPTHLKLISSSEPEYDEPEPLETPALHEAIAAVEAVIEASSLATRSVASYWRSPPSNQPTPDQIREAAHWLEMLADAMEEESDNERKRQAH
jgi:hypothetical protein